MRNQKNLILTKNFEINDKAEVKPLHDQFVKEGYEGIMIRNKDGEYGINKRSKNLQKFKEFYDQEFQIVTADAKNKVLVHFNPKPSQKSKISLEKFKNFIDKK